MMLVIPIKLNEIEHKIEAMWGMFIVDKKFKVIGILRNLLNLFLVVICYFFSSTVSRCGVQVHS